MDRRVIYLANIQRELTNEEQQELADYFDRDVGENEVEVSEAIGGRDHPIASISFDNMETGYGSSSDNDPTYELHSDDSNVDDPLYNFEPIQDIHLTELVQDMQNADIELHHVETPELAIEANRGQKYMGQGKNDQTVWWSMPSATEQTRTNQMKTCRLESAACSTETFVEKQSAFKRLLSTSVVESIVLETNRKAKRAIGDNQRQENPKRLRAWHNTNAEEIYAYIGILLYAGAEKSNLVQAKDLFAKSSMPFYRAVMSLERFEQICRFLRFDDSRTRISRLREDKLAPFRHIWTLFQMNLKLAFVPSKELTIDEQLVTSRNRCSFRQYIPSKPGKYGIKIFWLVDSKTNYPVSAEIYLGTQPNEERSTGISHALVLRLAQRHLNIGANITMDNFFTSYPLAKDLYARNTTLVGTVRSNKRELPKLFASIEEAKKRGPFASVFCFSDEISLVSYTTDSKKNVLLMSTAHANEQINATTKKPMIIHDYNDHKGGVDTFDKMVRGYTCKRKSNRWPMVLFQNMVDVAGLAAFRLFELCHPAWNTNKSQKRKIFLKELAVELVQPHLDNRCKLPLKPSVKIAMDLMGYNKKNLSSSKQFPEVQTKSSLRRCEPCKVLRTKKKDTKTTAVCDLCCKPTCAKHYIRACESCYQQKFKSPSDEEYSDEDDISYTLGLSTPGPSTLVASRQDSAGRHSPPAKRAHTSSPNQLSDI